MITNFVQKSMQWENLQGTNQLFSVQRLIPEIHSCCHKKKQFLVWKSVALLIKDELLLYF